MSGTNADERIGGQLQPSLETSEAAYFGEDELPELSLDPEYGIADPIDVRIYAKPQ
ncbi:hypothetical protein PV433_03415 [Paenibacillus sp. GYB004]|uniref:hypothetical protein n=1 Tax=Paenibacillus sp. GYB004 TaxID=2994393 RepID=UPI002F96E537